MENKTDGKKGTVLPVVLTFLRHLPSPLTKYEPEMFVLLGCPKMQTHLLPTFRVAIVGRSLLPNTLDRFYANTGLV